MNEFKKLRKSVRQQAVDEGIVRLVAQRTGMSTSTVSRTLAGRIDRPNKEVAAALNIALEELGISKEAVA